MPKILQAHPPRDADEQKKIWKLARAWRAPADWIERARIITLSWEGQRVPAIAARLGCHDKKVRRWLHRFNAGGLVGEGRRHCRDRPVSPCFTSKDSSVSCLAAV